MTNNRFQFTMSALHPIERRKAKGLHNVLIHAFCYLVVLFGHAPQLYVIYTSFQNTSGKIFVQGYSLNSYREALAQLQNAIPNTFLIGGVALLSSWRPRCWWRILWCAETILSTGLLIRCP